jgi:Tfp pilus assembly protein PilP
MKLTTGILAVGLMTGGLWAQNPNVINNVQSTSQAVQQAKTTPSAAQTAKPVAIVPVAVPAKGAAAPAAPVAKAAVKGAIKPTGKPKSVIAAKDSAPKPAGKAVAPATARISEAAKADVSKSAEPPKAPKPEEKKWAMSGKRDPFFSPVVQQPTGSGCSTGKKCLEIGQINLRGVVKSENGFIAVVTNSLNKAYFLRENDPVFNGYVMRITGDTVVFQETVQDKLGKPLIREVVKRIFTPAV